MLKKLCLLLLAALSLCLAVSALADTGAAPALERSSISPA